MLSCFAAVATTRLAVADDRAPRSLHMREHTSVPARIAQAAPDPAPEGPDGPDGRNGDDGNTEVIHVTAANLEHQRFTGRTPTTVLDATDLAVSGHATLGDILQAIPAQANAGNAQVNAGGDGTARINLRGLGAQRTLVLLNGRRLGNSGAGANSSVDINTIPLAMIERVEVVKDGASAVYGAEAIGGVVDIVTRPQYDGVDATVLTSTSQRGDAVEYNASVVAGVTTSDKATYFVGSAGYQHHGAVLGGDRAFSRYQDTYDYASKTAGHYLSTATPAGRLDVTGLGIQPPGCTSTLCKPNGDGTWANVGAGDAYNEAAENDIYTPSTRYNVYLTGGNRITEHMVAFAEVLWLWRNSSRRFSPVAFDADAPISKDSLYNPFGVDLTSFQRRLVELGPRAYDDTVSLIRFVTGVKGTLPATGRFKDWSYELAYNYNSADSRIDNAGELNQSHAADAVGPGLVVPQIPASNGTEPICVKTPGDPTSKINYVVPGNPPIIIPCVPVNLLLPGGQIPRDQTRNLSYDDLAHGQNILSMVMASAGGQLAELPDHGVITMSLGGDYRREAGSQDPPSAASQPGYTTGIEAQSTDYTSHLWEGFAELEIVPIVDGEIARRLELDLSARALDYTRFGSQLTYKLGGLFRTVHGLAARGSYATAYRAPSIFELTGGRTETIVAAEDPCDTGAPSVGRGTRALGPVAQARCAAEGVPGTARFATASQNAFIGGNQRLRPESAVTASAGVVFEPPELPGLALSADYWHIRIDHAIESLGVEAIFANCYDRGIESFCEQIHRDDTTHKITAIDQLLQNVDQTRTSGLDLAAWYDLKLPEAYGRVHAGVEAQYLFDYDLRTASQTIHGVGNYDLGVYPHVRANLSARWARRGGASGGFSLRYVGGYQECAGNDCNLAQNLATAHDVDRYVKLDLYGGYDLCTPAGLTSIQVGINNALDAAPPVVYNAPAANSDATAYDFVGRMFYLRLSQQY
ncbi:MAG TPA: TonB-dependent receptor [Kofleriaceae bacterium]